MKWGVVTFPGSCDDQDALYAIKHALGEEAVSLWHKEQDIGVLDAVLLPGGFSYGDYLRCGAMARFSPVMGSIVEFARRGGLVMAICNGFQIACEAGLLPGALIRNRGLKFVGVDVRVRVENTDTPFTNQCTKGETLTLPIKHGEGCYVADEATLTALEDNGQVIFRYVDASGRATASGNPNGSLNNIAGIVNAGRNVLGMMPHPEHATERLLGNEDGLKLFRSAAHAIRSGMRQRTASVVPGP